MAESGFVASPSSPPIENMLEKIPSSTSSFKDSAENECKEKRIKYEQIECDPQNKPIATKFVIDDDCEAFGHSVAAQLRQMPKIQKILAQRLISEVCCRGQLNTIQGNTWLTPQTNPLQQYQQMQFFNEKRQYYGGADCAMAQNNVMRYQTHRPAAGNPMTNTIHYRAPNLVNNLQQCSQMQNAVPTGTAVNSIQNLN